MANIGSGVKEMEDRQLMAAFHYIVNEVVRIITNAMKNGRLTNTEWDKANKLCEIFADEIKDLEEWKDRKEKE